MADLLHDHDEPSETQPRCPNCGSPVSKVFQRVMSDPRTGEVRACPGCDNESVQRAYGPME